jgi:uncharacterized protein (TIGR02453 family)
MSRQYFRPALFKFLEDLKHNNNRPWFLDNKPRYERDVRDPMLDFIADFGPQLKKFSPRYVADPRPTGGSMFRIYRDVRFSRDKSPYKTTAAAAFHHGTAGREVHSPSFYLHLSPDDVFVGCGMWRPPPDALAGVRSAIDVRRREWKKAITDRAFNRNWRLEGDSTVRPPRGFDPVHPLIEDLKRKDFIGIHNLKRSEVCAAGFMESFVRLCRTGVPLMRFLTLAVRLPW